MVSLASAEDVKPFAYEDHQKKDPFAPLVSSAGVVINL